MKCTTIEEALKNSKEVTNLYLSGEECQNAYTDKIEKLTNLKTLHFSPKLKEWSSFPKGFKKLNIDVLHVSGIRINELIGLKIKTLDIEIANIDILPLCKNFPDIEELSLSLGNSEFSIPKEIERLSKLKELSIRMGILIDVAREIANLKDLKILNLNRLNLNKLPVEFTYIPNIEEFSLKNSPKVTTLPETIEHWRKLEKILFIDCFKNREGMNFEDELFHKDQQISLPSSISKLKKLREFEIKFCPIKNLNALSELSNLEEIKVTQANLKSIDVLGKLTKLKKLDIENSYNLISIDSLSGLTNLEYLNISNTKVSDLKALHKLNKLNYLNVKGCSFDKNRSSTLRKTLLFFYSFENLKTMKASSITQQEWDNRNRNEALKKKMTPEEIISILGNKNTNLVELEKTLNAIEDLETVFNVSKNDAYDSTLEIAMLDTAVASNIINLSDSTLQKLIAVSFADTGMYDSYEVTIIVVNEIINRKCISGQKHVVKAFINCTTYYDAGHRYYGSTVQDQLIDHLFPDFELEPLVELILSIDYSLLHPESGDNMCSLYPHIFSKMKNDDSYELRVLENLSNYIFENINDKMVLEILDEILEKDISDNSKKTIEELKNTSAIINNALKSGNINDFEIMLQKLNTQIPASIFVDFNLEDAFNILPIKELSFDILLKAFTAVLSFKKTNTSHQIIKVLFAIDSDRLKQYLENQSRENEEFKDTLIKILSVDISEKEKNYINKFEYEEFAQKQKYFLQGKSEEDIKEELLLQEKKEIARKQKNELKEAFNQSIRTVNNDFFIQKSQEIINDELLTDYSVDMANYTTKTLINSLQNGDFSSAKKVVVHFAEKLLPVVGFSNKQYDVASNSIVLAIMSKDKEVEQLIFDKLLPKNFEAKNINNEILAFNLSCYYALKNNKKSMLLMIAQSLNLGKKPQHFKNDTDFSAYWEDQDFITVLNT